MVGTTALLGTKPPHSSTWEAPNAWRNWKPTGGPDWPMARKGWVWGLKGCQQIAAAAKHGGRDAGHDRLSLHVEIAVELI